MFEATDENDLEVAMVSLHGGTHIDNDACLLAPVHNLG